MVTVMDKRKQELEDMILKLISSFESESGVSVKEIVLKKAVVSVRMEMEE